MKIEKRILCPERLRRCPAQFSFVDHRLVREGYLRRAEANAWALYLVLVTVGDANGLSYYSEVSLSRLLSLPVEEIAVARRQLLAARMIAYEEPLYQVLALDGGNR
jgi:hypothetical protein